MESLESFYDMFERLNYMPIRIYGALLHFVNNAQMNIIHGNEVINILDFLPILNHGYCKKTMSTTLLILYCKMNGLYNEQMIEPDDLMIKSFGSDIPSHYYLNEKLMCEAVNENIISQQLNTFDVIKLYKNLNYESFPIGYLQSICSLNFDEKNMEELVKDKLDYEFHLLDEIAMMINYFSDNHLKFNLIEILQYLIPNKRLNLLLDQLIQNKYIKLLYNILICNDEQIKELLLHVDPRDYNNEAYNLALEINNGSELIKQNIIERNLYEKRVFTDNINSIIGEESDLPDNLLLYLKSII